MLANRMTDQEKEHASDKKEDNLVQCHFCGTIRSREFAIDNGWAPSFWSRVGQDEGKPVCPDCAREHLIYNEEDCEWEQV